MIAKNMKTAICDPFNMFKCFVTIVIAIISRKHFSKYVFYSDSIIIPIFIAAPTSLYFCYDK